MAIKKVFWSKNIFTEVKFVVRGALDLFNSAPKGPEQEGCIESIIYRMLRGTLKSRKFFREECLGG